MLLLNLDNSGAQNVKKVWFQELTLSGECKVPLLLDVKAIFSGQSWPLVSRKMLGRAIAICWEGLESRFPPYSIHLAPKILRNGYPSFQFNSVAQSCPILCDPMNRSTPGLPVHHQLPEFTQTHVHGVGDAIQPSHPLSSPSPTAPNPSQHQGLFQWVNSSHEVVKVLEIQLQHQSLQWTPRTDLI